MEYTPTHRKNVMASQINAPHVPSRFSLYQMPASNHAET